MTTKSPPEDFGGFFLASSSINCTGHLASWRLAIGRCTSMQNLSYRAQTQINPGLFRFQRKLNKC